jgi:uncharacterized DUF497 family protein
VRITFDPTKRVRTFEGRGLDFADAEHVFAGPTYTIRDERLAYPEPLHHRRVPRHPHGDNRLDTD